MRLLFKLATRGLIRDLRRTLITSSAIMLGLALFIFTDHISQGTYDYLIRTGISLQAGHLVLQREGFSTDPEQSLYLSRGEELTTTLSETLNSAQVKAEVIPRAQLSGVLRSASGIVNTMILAVDPEREPKVSDWHTKLIDAPPPSGEEGEPIKSEWLKSKDDRGIILGAALARQLDLTIGDKVIFNYQAGDEVISRLFRVRGVMNTGVASTDAMTALCTINGARAALKSPHFAHQVTVHLKDLNTLLQAEQLTQKMLKERPKLTRGEPYELLDWRRAIPALYQFSIKDRQSARVIFFILGIIIAIGVLNTVTMSVLERTKSFGVMLALGLSPNKISGLILMETFLLGAFASLLGLGLGLLISWPAVEYGIDYSSMVGDNMEMEGISISSVIHAVWSVPSALIFALLAWCLTILSGLWPAWYAAHIPPTIAMRDT